MKIRSANSTDQALWDLYVQQHVEASPYHRFGWGEAVAEAYGHRPCYWLAEENGQLVGVFPCIEMRSLFSGKKQCALPFCDLGAPLANSDEIKRALLEHASSQSAGILESRGIDLTADSDSSYPGQKVSMRLPLPESADDLMASFKSKLRSQIRKAEKNGLTYQTGRSEQLLKDFYEVMVVNMRALGSPVHSYEWFQSIVSHYGESCLISLVYLDEKPAGGGIILLNGKTAAIPWASTKAEFNRLAPNMLLYWSLLAYCADNQVALFDFGRSTYGEGTYKFKSQWGAKPFPLRWQTFNRGQLVLAAEEKPTPKWKTRLKSLVVTSWQNLPLSWTSKLGPILRKQIDL